MNQLQVCLTVLEMLFCRNSWLSMKVAVASASPAIGCVSEAFCLGQDVVLHIDIKLICTRELSFYRSSLQIPLNFHRGT